jgi:hypothetical protein
VTKIASIYHFGNDFGEKMTSVLLFIFASIGLTHILVDSSIFAEIRDWLRVKIDANVWPPLAAKLNKLLGCYQCMGFWCGLFTGVLAYGWHPGILFLCACASSFLSMWGAVYLNYLEANAVVIPQPLPGEIPEGK